MISNRFQGICEYHGTLFSRKRVINEVPPRQPATEHPPNSRLVFLLLLFTWAMSNLDVRTDVLRSSPLRIADFISRSTPPDISVMDAATRAIGETLQIAFLGTFYSMLFSFPLGMLAAANLAPKWVHLPLKSILTTLRAIPVILLALLFVSALGFGPFPGVLAGCYSPLDGNARQILCRSL